MNTNDVVFYLRNGYVPFPKTIQIEITRKCPFKCPQCYKTGLDNKELDFDYIKESIALAYSKGTRMFILNGGEPLLYKDFEKLLDLLYQYKDVRVNCFSSGYGLTKSIIDKIKINTNFHFSISMNGSTDNINSLSRQGYYFGIEAMKKMKKSACPFDVNWVARHDNTYDFTSLISLCKKYGARSITVTKNKLVGDTRKVVSELEKDDLIYLSKIINNDKEYIIVESCYPQLAKYINRSSSAMCYAGVINCMITIDKKFAPCTFLAEYAEYYDSIEEYWLKSNILKVIRSRKPCSKCSLNCKFCLAISLATLSNFNSELEECALDSSI